MQQKFLVKGSDSSALYDLEKSKVFKLNKAEEHKFKQFSYKKEDLLPFLKENKEMHFKHLNLELTSRCNLKCKHCYGDQEFGKKEKELSTKQWKKIIKQVAEFKPNFLLFTGGEALLRKDFNELVFYAHSLGINTSLFSNLTTLTDEQATALKETDSIVQFSAYGHKPELHDTITGVKESFEKQQKALKKLKQLGIPLHGQIILMNENTPHQEQIKQFFEKRGIPIKFSIARPSGRQHTEDIPGCATCSFPENYLPAREKIASIHLDFFVLKHFYNNCWIQRCGITPQGKVLACVFARDKVLGDLTKEKFRTVYTRIKENAAKYACDRINGCKNCSLRYACVDCRPWAHSLTSKWKEKNPYCKIKLAP